MTTTHILGSVVFLAACLAMFVPGIVQRRRHRRARAARRAALLASLRADYFAAQAARQAAHLVQEVEELDVDEEGS